MKTIINLAALGLLVSGFGLGTVACVPQHDTPAGAAVESESAGRADELAPGARAEGAWTKIDEDTYQMIREDGAVSIRMFGSKAWAALRERRALGAGAGALEAPPVVENAAVALPDEGATAEREARTGIPPTPDSVVASGDTCRVTYSIDHKTFIFAAGAANLGVQAQSNAAPDLFSPPGGVQSVTHLDWGMVTPAAAAAVQTPALGFYVEDQPALNPYNTLVTSSSRWYDPVQFGDKSLCSATAFSAIIVHYNNGANNTPRAPCAITQMTTFPTCTPVR